MKRQAWRQISLQPIGTVRCMDLQERMIKPVIQEAQEDHGSSAGRLLFLEAYQHAFALSKRFGNAVMYRLNCGFICCKEQQSLLDHGNDLRIIQGEHIRKADINVSEPPEFPVNAALCKTDFAFCKAGGEIQIQMIEITKGKPAFPQL